MLPPQRLEALGYKIAAYPLTLLSAATAAMRRALADLKAGRSVAGLTPFAELQRIVGFPAYDAEAGRYRDD